MEATREIKEFTLIDQKSVTDAQLILSRIEVKLEYIEKKIDKMDARQWQIIVLLLSYPLGLIAAKICHLF